MTEEKKPVKPGYKTTEFWLTAVAVLGGLLLSAGLGGSGIDTPVERIAALAVSVLASLGYTSARAKAKAGGS